MISEESVSELRSHRKKLLWGNMYAYLRLLEANAHWIVSRMIYRLDRWETMWVKSINIGVNEYIEYE